MIQRLPILLVTSLALFIVGVATVASVGLSGRNPPTGTPAMAALAGPSLRIDACTSVDMGETFTMDIWGLNVTNLLAWEMHFVYDRQIVEVVERDVRVFLASQKGSNVFDLSDPVPNTSGLYRMAAADLGSKDATENGSGILARITITAKEVGVSAAVIAQLDIDGDGEGDIGPTLTAIDEDGEITYLGDTNGDGLMEEENISSGQIAVGQPCITSVPTPPIEDILASLPALATPSTPSPSEEAPEAGATPSSGTPTSESQLPNDDSATPTPAPNETPSDADSSTTPDSASGPRGDDPGSGGGGLASWLIVVIAAVTGLGLILSFAIIGFARRPT